jgi:hypothetical protein
VFDGFFRADVGPGRPGAHGDGHAGAHQVHPAAGHDAAAVGHLLDGVGRQRDDVNRLAGRHAPGGIDTADGFDLYLQRCGLPECGDQVGQQLAGGHGGKDLEGGGHALALGASG